MLVAAAAFAASLMLASPALAVPETRLGSSDVIATAVAVSRASYPSTSTAAVIAWDGQNQLSASGLVGAVHAPLLLAPHSAIPQAVQDEIGRLEATRVFLVGPYTSAAIAQVTAAVPAGSEVVSIAGPTHAATSELVAHRVLAERGSAPHYVLVAPLFHWRLAEGLAAPAAARGWPVVFASAADPALPARTAAAVGATRALVVDAGTESKPAAGALSSALGASAVTRHAETDAYRSAWAIGSWSVANAGFTFRNPTFATRDSAANLISAGVLAGRRGSPVVELASASTPSWLADALFATRAGLASNAFVGDVPKLRATDVRHAQKAPLFSTTRAMAHIKRLAAMGPRKAGSAQERRAARYVADQLRSYGYTVRTQKVRISGGRTSVNVIAEKKGSSADVIVVGAHIDSKHPSPGANDNASGVGVTLELARILSKATVAPSVRFIGFGAEEVSGRKPTQHHYGSRKYVASLSSAERARIEAMVSVDMVGYGKTFTVRNLKKAPRTTERSLRSWASYTGQKLVYLKDPSKDGWSDHEAFEFKGVPVGWLEWRTDPTYHSKRDKYSHVSSGPVGRTGRLMRGWLLNLNAEQVDALRK